MRYIAVIGDIVESRNIQDRPRFQEQFYAAVTALNQRTRLLSPFTVTLGDEVQALYAEAPSLFRDLWHLAATLYPQRIRFAIGIGELTTPVNPQSAIGMDGPAFHRARDGITSLKAKKDLMRIVGAATDDFMVENEALKLISHLCRAWRSTRWRVLQEMVCDEPINLIAQRLRITPAAVYKSISAGPLDVVISLGDKIGTRLTRAVRDN